MQLLKHFHELSLHPKNAKELKGLILQLAVQGKLTAQWRHGHPELVEGDHSAKSLLERIKEEKAQLIKEGKIKKEKPLPPITKNEVPYGLPESWVWCWFGSVNINIHYGYTASAMPTTKGVRLLRITDIQNNGVDWLSVPGCSISEKDLPKYLLHENDILIARTGGTIGKSFQVKNIIVKSVFASYLIRAIPNKQLIPEYLKLFIETPLYWGQLYEKSKGTGQPNVNATSLKQLKVPLPPLEEQKAIVRVVEQLFKEVEQLEQLTAERIRLKEQFATSALRQLTTNNTSKEWGILKPHFHSFFNETPNIKKLRESILQLAVQGKLTKHWRSLHTSFSPQGEMSEGQRGEGDHSAKTLLEKIKAEKAQLIKEGKIKKEKPLPPITEDDLPAGEAGIPYELPDGWVWCRMQDLCPNISSGSTPPKPYFKESGIPYLKVYNIREQKIDFAFREQFVDQEYNRTKLKRSILYPGDVIMNIVGPPLGKVAIIPNDYPEWNCNQAITFFKPIVKELNVWL